jgi:hypothetical protein
MPGWPMRIFLALFEQVLDAGAPCLDQAESPR